MSELLSHWDLGRNQRPPSPLVGAAHAPLPTPSGCAIVHHAAGSCRMGDDAGAVVDWELKVRDIERLRVVDASICPSLPAGNTNAIVVMIAEKAADLILGRPAPAVRTLPHAC